MDTCRVVGEFGGKLPAGVVVGLTFRQWENRMAFVEDAMSPAEKGPDGKPLPAKPLDPPWRKVAWPKDRLPLEDYPLCEKRLHPEDKTRVRRFLTKTEVAFKRGEVFTLEPDALPKVSRNHIENVTELEFAELAREELKAKQAAEKEARNAKVDAEAAAKKAAKVKPAAGQDSANPSMVEDHAGSGKGAKGARR